MDSTSPKPTFLKKDPEIRGQNYACVSFVSPEDVVLDRELFNVKHFLQPVAKDIHSFVDGLHQLLPADGAEDQEDSQLAQLIRGMRTSIKEKFAYLWDDVQMQASFNTFKSDNASSLDTNYAAQYGPRTCLRAFKVRGVYDTLAEAKERCNELRDVDNGMFNIYVATVGCWVPWSPNPDEIADSVYAEKQLNQLMTKYAENSKLKDKIYQDRLESMKDMAIKEGQAHSRAHEDTEENEVSVSVIQDELFQKDNLTPIDEIAGQSG